MMWYKITAYNTEARYGWTDDPAVAQAALDWLNKGREVNVYSLEALGDDTDEFDLYGDGEKHNLEDRNDHLFTADTRVEDFENKE